MSQTERPSDPAERPSQRPSQHPYVFSLSSPLARCVLCGDLIEECVCAFDCPAPSIFWTPSLREAAQARDLTLEDFDLSDDSLEE